jgi:hypothetical protein
LNIPDKPSHGPREKFIATHAEREREFLARLQGLPSPTYSQILEGKLGPGLRDR